MVDGVEDVLAHFHVPFSATCQLVIERMGQARELRLRHEMVPSASHMTYGSMVEIRPHGASYIETNGLLEERQLIDSPLLQLVPLGIAVGCLSLSPGP